MVRQACWPWRRVVSLRRARPGFVGQAGVTTTTRRGWRRREGVGSDNVASERRRRLKWGIEANWFRWLKRGIEANWFRWRQKD
jgi:hypothetical protein